jgi:predicted ATP-grasp superfamily ATP-dependent carboligase
MIMTAQPAPRTERVAASARRRAPARVLVCDGDTRTALATVRSLVAAGHHVWAAAPARSLAGVSRGVRPVRIGTDPLDAPETFARAVAAACDRLAIDVLLPVTDASASALLQFRTLLPSNVALPMPEPHTFRLATDKASMQFIAEAAGFAVPRSVAITNESQLDAAIQAIGLPAVLKPHRSVVMKRGGHAEHVDVHVVTDLDAARRALGKLPRAAFPVLVQERIVGEGEGCFALRWNGKMIACFGHRRLREKPPAGGVSVYRESVAVPDDLRVATERLLESLDWQGVAMIECKRDASSGKHVFMELNGRLWGSLQLAIDAGVDFPALLVARALGDDTRGRVPTAFVPGIRSQWFWGDVDHLYARLFKPPTPFPVAPPLGTRWATVRDFVRASLDAATRNEIGRWDDPAPAVLEWTRRLGLSAPSVPAAVPVVEERRMPARFARLDPVAQRMSLHARRD